MTKNVVIYEKNSYLQYWIIGLLSIYQQAIFIKFSDISISLKHAWNRTYGSSSAQRLGG